MATKKFTGLLEQFGLPTVSQEELLAARNKQRLEESNVLAREVALTGPALERDFRRIGGLIGGALGVKLNPSKLTPDEIKSRQAVAAAETGFQKEISNNPELSDDGIQAEITYQKKLAEALVAQGMYPQAVQIMANATQKMRAYEKQRKEAEKLDIDIDNARTRGAIQDFQLDQAKRGEFTTVYPKDNWVQEAAIDLFIDPETGDAVRLDEEGNVLSRMPAGSFTTAKPPAPLRDRGGRPLTANELGISDVEARTIRQQLQASREQLRGAEQIRDILIESANEGSPGINVLGTQGTLTTGVVRIVDTLQGVARQIGGSVKIRNADGSLLDINDSKAQRRYLTEHRSDIERELAQFIPDNIRGDSTLQESYYAAMIRLTNARMRAVEPGARQLSDEDFRRALRETAGATSNPEAFRRIMFGNVLNNAREAKDRLDWLPPTVPHDLIINPRELNEFNRELELFEEAFSLPFGTASSPGPGLGGPAGGSKPQQGGEDPEERRRAINEYYRN